MGIPTYQIKDDIQKYGISVFSSNYTLYADMSGRVMSILAEQVRYVSLAQKKSASRPCSLLKLVIYGGSVADKLPS
ncbi:hypothetical protein J8K86_04610 [Bacteroides fragilis]|uniref:hypothetical protein n=1 Tax=Bacteroides TaxID=816 RepID=UPI003313E015|nr:hypothetical protein [Bacteroides fragilis]